MKNKIISNSFKFTLWAVVAILFCQSGILLALVFFALSGIQLYMSIKYPVEKPKENKNKI